MRFLIAVILIIILALAAEYYMPWWTVAVVSFVVALFSSLTPGRAFLAGFAGVGLLWLGMAILHDIPNAHILSARMAALFHLSHYALFIMITVLVGGLAGGLSAWAAALLNIRKRKATFPESTEPVK